jgi:energy-converting hydrogenase Eha subunit B
MVPGWGFGLHISHALLFVIAIAAGVIGGALMGGRYFLAGIVGGGLASLGALLAQTTYLAMVDSTWNILLALLMVIGAAPGAIVGYNLARLQIRLAARADLPKGPPDDPDNPYRQP